MYFLTDTLYFPPVTQADRHGLLAVGGDLSPERLLLAYQSGIFPWFDAFDPILWWSPPKRMILFFDELKISKTMRKVFRDEVFEITFNENFYDVITACQQNPRDGQDGTWITDDMRDAYCKLHELGFAKSVEVWKDEELVGGLYGVDLGHVFCGESMFSTVSNASKAAFIFLAKKLQNENYRFLDCQNYSEHLESLGAREISRDEFLEILVLK